ncbi:MAG: TIGR03016 family PEP-CTERM system-associated outer membrane protein [Alphaproteobacteria bacterium]|nr:TIGR03016 family PEP-CTERM system-associated outer membrane protein [Alphaproteobacteria bacterium]
MRIKTAVSISGILLLAAQPTLAQQADTPQRSTSQLAPQSLLNAGAGGYGAAPLFAPFPTAGALLPPSFQVPDLKPQADAPRPVAVTVSAAGREKFTNNVYRTAGPTKSDFVTTANGTVAADVDSRLIKGGLKYGLGYDKYATYSEMDGFRHNGIGLFDAELIDQRLFLAARASVSEQSVSQREHTGQTGQSTGAGSTSAGNTVRVYTQSIAPRFQQRFGDVALGQISYHHDETRYEDVSKAQSASTSSTAAVKAADLDKSVTDGGRLEVRSGESFSRLLWDYTGDVDHEETKGRTYDQVSNTLGAEYRLSGDFSLLAAVGNDYIHSNSVDLDKYGGVFYTGGVHWTPSPATDLRFGLGHRYDRPNWIILGAHWLGPRTVLRVSSDSGITTDALSFEKALNAVRRDETGNFVNPFSGFEADPATSPFARSNAIYWQRNTDFVLRHDEVRDSFALSVRLAEQRILGGYSGSSTTTLASGSATSRGASLSWRHHLTPAISSMAMISQSDTIVSDTTPGRTTQRKGSAELSYSMNPTLLGSLGYSVATTSPTPAGSIREDVIAVGIKKTF